MLHKQRTLTRRYAIVTLFHKKICSPIVSHNPHKAVFNGHPADWYNGHRDYAENNGLRSCRVCHGTDLTGGSGPSCYTCHGPVWRED
jgi:hypothetical protein